MNDQLIGTALQPASHSPLSQTVITDHTQANKRTSQPASHQTRVFFQIRQDMPSFIPEHIRIKTVIMNGLWLRGGDTTQHLMRSASLYYTVHSVVLQSDGKLKLTMNTQTTHPGILPSLKPLRKKTWI